MGKVLRILRHLWILVFLLVLSAGIVGTFALLAKDNGRASDLSLAPAATGTSPAGSAVASATPARSPTPPPYPGPATMPTAAPRPPASPTPTVPAAVLTPIAMPPSTYISKEVVVASAGSGPGQVGITVSGSDGLGPQSFTTDTAGNIYVIDAVNSRVNKYDPVGRFLSSFDYDRGISAIAIDVWRDGSIYLGDVRDRYEPSGREYQAVYKLDPAGKVLQTYKWYDVYQIEDVRVDASGGVWAQGIGGFHEDVAKLGTVNEPSDPQAVVQAQQPGFLTSSGASLILWGQSADRRWGYGTVTFGDGRQIAIQIPPLADSRFSRLAASVIGTDQNGGLYLRVMYDSANLSEDHMLVYDRNGTLTGQALMPGRADYTRMERPMYADDQGRIYRMYSVQGGITIVRWEKTG